MLMIKNKGLRKFSGFLETLSWLQLKLLVRRPEAALKFPSFVFRRYMMLAKSERWNSVSIEDFVDTAARLQITLVHLQGRGLHNCMLELAYLALIALSSKPKAIFEIGTFCGRTALHFALNTPEDCMIYTLDLPDNERPAIAPGINEADARLIQQCQTGLEYRGTRVEKKIQQLYGNSVHFDFGPYIEKVDVVFVDGCHDYSVVRSDSINALRMVKPGGLVIWHDFANYGDYHDVTRAVLELVPAKDLYQIGDTQLAVYRKPLHKNETD